MLGPTLPVGNTCGRHALCQWESQRCRICALYVAFGTTPHLMVVVPLTCLVWRQLSQVPLYTSMLLGKSAHIANAAEFIAFRYMCIACPGVMNLISWCTCVCVFKQTARAHPPGWVCKACPGGGERGVNIYLKHASQHSILDSSGALSSR